MSCGLDIAHFLADNDHGVLGHSIRVSQMLEIPDIQIAVNEYDVGGGLDAMSMSTALSHITPTVQIMVRDIRYEDAYDRAMEAFNDLIAVKQLVLTPSGTRYEVLQPINTPALFERDDKKRVTFVFNIQALKEQ